MTSKLWLTDRTRTTTDWLCRRKRYLNYHYLGRGIVTEAQAPELLFGSVIHEGLAAVATQHLGAGVDIDSIAEAARRQLSEGSEASHLAEALLRAFHRHVWPRLMRTYPRIIAVEPELTYALGDGTVFMSRPDLILENSDGEWTIIEFKTTGSKNENWITQWNTAIQLHSTMMAVESTLGKMPLSVVVIGLYKGSFNYGKLSTPLIYGYLRQGQPPLTKTQLSYEYQKGFLRTPVWQLSGGIKGWISSMPEGILGDQFPTTPPIFLREDMVEAFFRQLGVREHVIREALSSTDQLSFAKLDTVFPQNFSECQAYGRPCEYLPICHGRVEDPLRAGFQLRTPHHLVEQLGLDIPSEV